MEGPTRSIRVKKTSKGTLIDMLPSVSFGSSFEEDVRQDQHTTESDEYQNDRMSHLLVLYDGIDDLESIDGDKYEVNQSLRPGMQKKSGSLRNILNQKLSKDAGSRTVAQREKQKRLNKVQKKHRDVSEQIGTGRSPTKLLAALKGDGYNNNSWRSKDKSIDAGQVKKKHTKALKMLKERSSSKVQGDVPRLSLEGYIQPKVATQPSKEELLTLFENCLTSINALNWPLFVQSISSYPDLLALSSSSHNGRNMLHIISSLSSPVPELVVETIINLCPTIVTERDDDKCTPLHHAASSAEQLSIVKLLISEAPESVSMRNVDGDLPIHVASWAGESYEDAVKELALAYPTGLSVANKLGALPLHLACCRQTASPSTVAFLIKMQEPFRVSINSLDKNGNSPLHVAIKTKAPLGVVEVFRSEVGEDAFITKDNDKRYPLHIALSMEKVNSRVVSLVATAAPNIMRQAIGGYSPATLAAERGLSSTLVKQLLLGDMPIKFAKKQQNSILNGVKHQVHAHSWWYLTTKFGAYSSVVDDILSKYASVPEVIALSQTPDPNGALSVLQQAHRDVKSVIHKNLRFCERYELITQKRTKIQDGILEIMAMDFGSGIGWEEMAGKISSHRTVRNGYTAVSGHGSYGSDGGFEVVYYPQPEREVLLLCCLKHSEGFHNLVEEMDVRKSFNFSHIECQRLYNVHMLDGVKLGCSGKMMCLALERPVLTLLELFETSRFRRRKTEEWSSKCRSLLKRLAELLRYLHQCGFVHGHIEPSTVARFNGVNNWKLMNLRGITPIGETMTGDLRFGAPPEIVLATGAVKSFFRSFDQGGLTKLVSFDDEDGSSPVKRHNDGKPSCEFRPDLFEAEVSWDVWSFGLIMGHLVLGQSAVLLPNFEKAADAHLKNLYNYDSDALEKIVNGAKKVGGVPAAHLLESLLQPEPAQRPQSMDEILGHEYFTANMGTF